MSDGLFLYIHHMCEMIKSSGDMDSPPDAVPLGLAGVYNKELEKAVGPECLGDSNSETRCVVEAIVAAQVSAVHMHEELPGLSGVSHDAAVKVVNKLSRLLSVRGNRVCVFHKSVSAWLTRDDGFDRSLDGSKFVVNRCAAHRRLALACGVPLMRLLSHEAERFSSDAHAVAALAQLIKTCGCTNHNSRHPPALGELL